MEGQGCGRAGGGRRRRLRDGEIDLEKLAAIMSDKNANVSRMKIENGDVVTVP